MLPTSTNFLIGVSSITRLIAHWSIFNRELANKMYLIYVVIWMVLDGYWMCVNYILMFVYVQTVSVPVHYRDSFRFEVPWHKCITHVIHKKLSSFTTGSEAIFCHCVYIILHCAT